jgi:hypothetical protein
MDNSSVQGSVRSRANESVDSWVDHVSRGSRRSRSVTESVVSGSGLASDSEGGDNESNHSKLSNAMKKRKYIKRKKLVGGSVDSTPEPIDESAVNESAVGDNVTPFGIGDGDHSDQSSIVGGRRTRRAVISDVESLVEQSMVYEDDSQSDEDNHNAGQYDSVDNSDTEEEGAVTYIALSDFVERQIDEDSELAFRSIIRRPRIQGDLKVSFRECFDFVCRWTAVGYVWHSDHDGIIRMVPECPVASDNAGN